MFSELKKSAAFFDHGKVWFGVVVWRASQTSCVLQCEKGPSFSGVSCGSTAGGKLEDKERAVSQGAFENPVHSQRRLQMVTAFHPMTNGSNKTGLKREGQHGESPASAEQSRCHRPPNRVIIICAGD